MIFIGLGANLPSHFGGPAETLEAAIEHLDNQADMDVVKRSSQWRTAPVPISDQPWYHNAVIQIDTALDIPALLALLKSIEQEFGRVEAMRNAARVLDMDIIAYNDVVYDQGDIIVPHPRMDQRAFVLLPLEEIYADWVHPKSGESIQSLIKKLPKEQRAEKWAQDAA